MTGALLFSFLAASSASLGNFFFRKSAGTTQKVGSLNGYLFFFFLSSFLFALCNSLIFFSRDFNLQVFGFGAFVGVLTLSVMLLTAKALEHGPAGMTFAFQNASAVFPGLILFLFLGEEAGFSSSITQAAGMLLVLLGIFIGAKGTSKFSFTWLAFAIGCFLAQVLTLTMIQGRIALFESDRDAWFMPGQFGVATLFQGILYLKEKRKVAKTEAIYGILGGVTNFIATSLLLLATTVALPFEQGALFPCFAVSALILCNAWAYKLYGENFNLKANLICTAGILISTLL